MRLSFVLALFLAGCASVSSTSRPPTVSFVDLKRYMGRWYVIANIPYFLEKGKVATFDAYQLLPDGKIENNFTFRKGSFDAPEKTWHGKATVTNPKTNAEWKVSFFWPIYSTYLVIDLDADYQWAVVGTPDRKLLWVLGRERHLSDEMYKYISERVSQRGYNPALLVKVPQPTS